jgi:hypothetical protein
MRVTAASSGTENGIVLRIEVVLYQPESAGDLHM